MDEPTFRVYETESGTFRWRLCDDWGESGNGDQKTVLATGGGAYATRAAAMRAVQRVKHVAPEAGVESAGPDGT
ncbi:MAG: YegP family protein [Haloplanus sp.]